MNSGSRPPTAPRSAESLISPAGGVASRTLPDACDLDRDDVAFDEPFGVEGPEPLDVLDEPDLDALEPEFFGVERFLDGPHVDMTPHTVPRGCYTEP